MLYCRVFPYGVDSVILSYTYYNNILNLMMYSGGIVVNLSNDSNSEEARGVAMVLAELLGVRGTCITSFKMSGFGRGGRGAALRQVGPVLRRSTWSVHRCACVFF